ncbi:MAG: hypothetical protein KF733_03325 [Fimbriimonadaceae bacterium]|nr:MAG: hypothetical protein KF733_03325 [Fimbriimonadaceae bacterium]
MALHYLTVPDMLWINLQVTGAPQPYRYDRLEEATFYQYGRGNSLDPVAQAARMLVGFRRMRPFDRGNEATAFVATVTFLRMNGHDVAFTDDEAGDWTERASASEADAARLLQEKLAKTKGHADNLEVHDSHDAARSVLDAFPGAISSLLANETSVPLG